ncbi:MAG TPA: 16S rRNA (cytosine(1402)-N(4))-methyltransferase RsmH [Burkholderiales bacterium]|nr:16S rRNA (cytosine(1402)-N(4))-methyltransferase RsmH [Burkholderiales bacterium]
MGNAVSELRHETVLLEEAVAALEIKPTGTYIDGTFGRGGHSRRILAALGPEGRLIAFDKDPAATEAAKRIVDPRFIFIHASFGELKQSLAGAGVTCVDGVLLDLGVSSPQIDDPGRGFSFRADGPLDMRMDLSRGEAASQWLATAKEEDIRGVIENYGEERFAKQIARKIVESRAQSPIATTRQLAQIVAGAVRTREPGQDPATRTFQAIRIFINKELEELSIVLPQAVDVLAVNGRLAVISFHSLEDRIVKRFMRDEATADRLPRDVPVRARDLKGAKLKLVGKPVRPSTSEVAANPRSRSAIMRIAEKAAVL